MMAMKYMAIILIFLVGCSSPLRKIESERDEKTRQGVEALGAIFASELGGAVEPAMADALARAGALVNGLQILWGIPEKSIATDVDSTGKWLEGVKETKKEERRVKEKLLAQKLKENAKAGGQIKFGFLGLGALGLIVATIYVRFQYGKLAAWVVGVIGGAVLIGYVVITYKVLIFYGGLVFGAVAIVYLGIALFREGKFSKAAINVFQKVRKRLQVVHPEAAKEVDFVLETGQRESEKKKIRRLKGK